MDKLTPHDVFTFLDATLYVGSTETKHNSSRKNQNKGVLFWARVNGSAIIAERVLWAAPRAHFLRKCTKERFEVNKFVISIEISKSN